MKIKKTTLVLAFTLYGLGAIAGLTLIFIATWADLEATFYGFPKRSISPLPGFSCPILMTADETGTFSVNVVNTTDKLLYPSVKVEISTPVLPYSTTEYLKLAPGESQLLEWEIGPQNIDLGHFIFAKALVYSAYPLRNREEACGIFIADLPASGSVIVVVMVVLSLLGMGAGLFFLFQDRQSSLATLAPPLLALTVVILFGIVFSFMDWWLLGLLTLVLTLMLIVVTLGFLVRAK